MEASSSSNYMASDLGKLFVGGIADGTREDEIMEHFKKFGEVKEVVLVKNRDTGNARGFGFVHFESLDSAEAALREVDHRLAGRKVEVKKARPKSEHRRNYQSPHHQYPILIPYENRGLSNNAANGYCINENPTKSKKIFVGGLSSNATEDEFRSYFEKFGRITDVVIIYDSSTHRPRGFGFITFDSEEAVDSVMQQSHHQLNNKQVEVKLAVPKDGNNHNNFNTYNGSSYNSSMSGGRGHIGNYQSGTYSLYGHRNEFYSGYAPSIPGFYCGPGGYGGGYPIGPYGGMGYVTPFLSPRMPYSGLGMMRRSPMHYDNAAMYHGYPNSGFGGYMSVAGSGRHHETAWSGDGRLNRSADDVRITEDNVRTADVESVTVDALQAS